jgi:hypothetical protein
MRNGSLKAEQLTQQRMNVDGVPVSTEGSILSANIGWNLQLSQQLASP